MLFYLGAENICPVCNEKCGSDVVCKNCESTYFVVNDDEDCCCKKCGRILVSEKDLCLKCRENPVFKEIHRAFPLFGYRLWNIQLLCSWKMKEQRCFSFFFAKLMARKISFLQKKNPDLVVVPVPPRNGKIKKMGWDQVEEIASILENIYNIKVQRLLQRNSTKQQKKLHRQERLSTIGTSYSLKQEVYDVPQKVVVLDDIITTGATLESCAKVLKEAGVKEVYGISLYSVD